MFLRQVQRAWCQRLIVVMDRWAVYRKAAKLMFLTRKLRHGKVFSVPRCGVRPEWKELYTDMRGKEIIEQILHHQPHERTAVYGVVTNDALIERISGEKLAQDNTNNLTATVYRKYIDLTRPFKDSLGPRLDIEEDSDEFGYLWRHERWTSWMIKAPYTNLVQMKTALGRQIEFFRAWKPQPQNKEEVMSCSAPSAVENMQKLIGRNTLVTGHIPIGTAPGPYFRDGLENFSYLLADYPDIILEWVKSRHQMNLRKIQSAANITQTMLEFIDADIAYKNGLIVSAAYLKSTGWFSRLAELVDCFHSHGIAVVFHSDGDLREILPDIVHTGIDGLNPIETAAGMSLHHLHAAFPDLILIGGLDNHILINGTVEQVKQATLSCLQVAGGLLILGSSTEEFDVSMPIENIIAALDTVMAHKIK